jgi:predicted flap endonuclease-1-like 5' DNA nuclease
MAKIVDVEGIGPVYAEKLIAAGIKTTGKLLKAGATPKGRAEIEEKTGISHSLVLEWVNHVDLYRIKGVGQEYSDLLEEAGVDTVPELAQRNPENLYAKMVETNEMKKLVRQLPSQRQVTDWVMQAKALPRVIQY